MAKRRILKVKSPHACITLAQTLLVWLPCECAQHARCVLVSLSSSSHERRQPHLQRAQRRSPMFNRLLVHALPAVIHLRLHWTGPPAPLSRGICFPTHQPLCFSPAVAGLQSYIIVIARTTARVTDLTAPSQRSSWRCLTVFIVLFVDLPVRYSLDSRGVR